MNVQALNFDGGTYEPEQDAARLTGQLHAVMALMKDGEFRTLRQIADQVNGSEAGVSARLRDLRKPRFGGHTVNRQRVDGGLFSYQLVLAVPGGLFS